MAFLRDEIGSGNWHQHPWWSPYQNILREVFGRASPASVAAALNACAAEPCFVEHAALPAHEPYESFIARTKTIPTRDNLHDLFNGIVWLKFPRTKRRLNELHAAAIGGQRGGAGRRGALRDALTIFDENAALLRAPPPLVEALRAHDWSALFLTHRALWEKAELLLFGHALMEKLLEPRKPITAHVWVVDELHDATLAGSLTPERLRAKAFLPLPVLGIPGWWLANEDASFYDDPLVFRAPRVLSAAAERSV